MYNWLKLSSMMFARTSTLSNTSILTPINVFPRPPYQALTITLNEGYDAKMSLGIPAENCLYADLNLDPSRPDCQTLGARDNMLRERPTTTD